MSCRYGCTCCLAVFMFVWVERILMLSEYVMSFILFFFCEVGMAAVYRLNSFGESTPPCGTPFLLLLVLILCCCIV